MQQVHNSNYIQECCRDGTFSSSEIITTFHDLSKAHKLQNHEQNPQSQSSQKKYRCRFLIVFLNGFLGQMKSNATSYYYCSTTEKSRWQLKILQPIHSGFTHNKSTC